MLACQNGHAAATRLLLDRGADVNRAKANGWTPLMASAQNGHGAVARLLLERGADASIVRSSAMPSFSLQHIPHHACRAPPPPTRHT